MIQLRGGSQVFARLVLEGGPKSAEFRHRRGVQDERATHGCGRGSGGGSHRRRCGRRAHREPGSLGRFQLARSVDRLRLNARLEQPPDQLSALPLEVQPDFAGHVRSNAFDPEQLLLGGRPRVRALDGRKHPPAGETLLLGHSVGRWEGNTLVVETTNFKDHPMGLSTSLPSSAGKRLTERFSLSPDGKNLIYSARVASLARRGAEFGIETNSLAVSMKDVQRRKRLRSSGGPTGSRLPWNSTRNSASKRFVEIVAFP